VGLYKGQAAAACCTDGAGEAHDDDDDGGTVEEGSETPSWPGAWTFGHARDEVCVLVTRVLCCVYMWLCGKDETKVRAVIRQRLASRPFASISPLSIPTTHHTHTGHKQSAGTAGTILAWRPRRGGGIGSHFPPSHLSSSSSSSSSTSTPPTPLLLLAHHHSSSTLPRARVGCPLLWVKSCLVRRLGQPRSTCKSGDVHS